MGNTMYQTSIENKENNTVFCCEVNHQGQLISLKHKADSYRMNWLNGKDIWGRVQAPADLTVTVHRHYTQEGRLQEIYTFLNETEFDVFSRKNEIGITTTFPDDYKSAEICMKERCHIHVWCGKNTAYLYGLRMGGEAPHLGIVLRSGSIDGYSVTRDVEASSNDRGCILLHPEKFHLKPGEKTSIVWEFVWFKDREEFFEILKLYKNAVHVHTKTPISFQGEAARIQIEWNGTPKKEEIKVLNNGIEVPIIYKSEKHAQVIEPGEKTGIKNWDIFIQNSHTTARTLVLPRLDDFAESRCRYIVEKQQYHEAGNHLDGAFLIYDTEENAQYYSHKPDQNGGRERIGMGVLLARYLQKHSDNTIEEGLVKYTKYVCRELFDEVSGTVFNDVKRNNDWHRLYNYPWAALLFLERFNLFREKKDLRNMYRVIQAYYRYGGTQFYAIGLPIEESITLLKNNEMEKESEELLKYYLEHADYILENGLKYPAHEVNYEQSIVAPAVSLLLQTYNMSHEEKYLAGAEEQLRVLELFNGKQPDYQLYEMAIRHWDGYWFGKRKVYGDTFPHYWSALSGNAFMLYWKITGEIQYLEKARASLRGTLSLFSESGSASCAYIYPQSINGIPGDFADPWANDQDWGMYFCLKSIEEYEIILGENY